MLNKETLKDFRTHMAAAAAELGIELDIGKITFSENHAKFTAEIFAENGRQTEFAKYASKFGYEADWFDTWFTDNNGLKHLITGVNPRARKYPIETIGESGGKMRWAAESIRRYSNV